MKHFPLIVIMATVFFTMTLAAHAYVGPGAGLTVIGSALALIVGVILAIVGFIWYPLKRILRKYSNRKNKTTTQVTQPLKEENE